MKGLLRAAPGAIGLCALGAFSLGCGETEECRQLNELLVARKAVLAQARTQSGVTKQLEARAKAAEEATNKLLGELGMNDPESKIAAVLEARVARFSGATIERTTAQVDTGSAEPSAVRASETMWVVRFKEKDVEKAFSFLDALIATPPLVKFATLAKDKKKDEWRVELIRLVPDQIPIKPEPTKLSPPKDLKAIASQMGSCGAVQLRAEIVKVDAEISKLEPDADRTTVLLPTGASWEGLKARAEALRDAELEARRHVRTFIESVRTLKLPLKAIGVEGAIVALEVWGQPRDRARIEKDLIARGAGEQLKVPESSAAGVVRMMLPNTIAEGRRSRRPARSIMPDLPAPMVDPGAPAARGTPRTTETPGAPEKEHP